MWLDFFCHLLLRHFFDILLLVLFGHFNVYAIWNEFDYFLLSVDDASVCEVQLQSRHIVIEHPNKVFRKSWIDVLEVRYIEVLFKNVLEERFREIDFKFIAMYQAHCNDATEIVVVQLKIRD